MALAVGQIGRGGGNSAARRVDPASTFWCLCLSRARPTQSRQRVIGEASHGLSWHSPFRQQLCRAAQHTACIRVPHQGATHMRGPVGGCFCSKRVRAQQKRHQLRKLEATVGGKPPKVPQPPRRLPLAGVSTAAAGKGAAAWAVTHRRRGMPRRQAQHSMAAQMLPTPGQNWTAAPADVVICTLARHPAISGGVGGG